jgi:hypothetical protein
MGFTESGRFDEVRVTVGSDGEESRGRDWMEMREEWGRGYPMIAGFW